MIEWDTVIISTVLSATFSGLTGYRVAWYFRHKVKPKHEILFENNQNSTILRLFSLIELFDSNFRSFYEIFETRLGELKTDQEEIIPSPFVFLPLEELKEEKPPKITFGMHLKKSKEFETLKENLSPTLKRMREYHNNFLKEYSFFMNYLDDIFLRYVNNYFFTTTYYSEWVLKGYNYSSIGQDRKKYAEIIIKYLKDNKFSLDNPRVKEFITKWEEYKKDN